MLRKVFRTGNSVEVSLPREALDYLNIQEGAEIEVDLDRENHRVILKPVEAPLAISGVDEQFAQQVAELFDSLPKHKRRVAEILATSETTKTAARKFGVSPGRISQTRRELETSWREFQGDSSRA